MLTNEIVNTREPQKNTCEKNNSAVWILWIRVFAQLECEKRRVDTVFTVSKLR